MARWTREEAERVLMACREADPALFGPETVTPKGDGYVITANSTHAHDNASTAAIVARAAVLAGVTSSNEVALFHNGKPIRTWRLGGEEVA